MKRFGGLWNDVVSFENLLRATYQVLRGKRSQEHAGDFFHDLEGNVLRLRRELQSGCYHPGDYRTFWISDPKPRLISAAPFRDRVVHHICRLKEGIEFLGFVFFPHTVRLNQRGVRRQRDRQKRLLRSYSQGDMTWEQIEASLQAWNAHASYGDTWRLREVVFERSAYTRP